MLRVLSVMSLSLSLVFVLALSNAWAQDNQEPAEPAAKAEPAAAAEPAQPAAQEDAQFELLEAKLTSGIENKQAKDEATSFNAGERAWLWMKTKAAGEANLRLRWSWAPNRNWTMNPKKVRNGRMWFYKTLHKTGDWKVEVLADNDQVVKEFAFTVTEAAAADQSPQEAGE